MRNIVILGLVSLFTDISSEMVYPILPLFLSGTLGAGPAVIGLIEGIAESLASLVKVFSGYWGDRTQKNKQIAITGYSLSTLSKLILYAAFSWWWVLGARIIDRFGKGIRTAPRDLLIAQSSTAGFHGKSFGLHRSMDTLGAIIGVILAYLLMTTSDGKYTLIFIISLIPAFIGVGLLFLVRSNNQQQLIKRKPIFKWSVLDKRLRFYLIISGLFALGNSSDQFLLLRAQNLGFGVRSVLLLYLVYNITYGITAYPAGRLSDKIGRRRVLVTGYAFFALVYFGFALITNKNNLWYLFGLYGLYVALTEGVGKALLTDISSPEVRGTVIGLHAALVGIGLLPASIFAGFLWKFFGPTAPFFLGGGLGLLAAIGLWILLHPKSHAFSS